jgi:hypothetical protein
MQKKKQEKKKTIPHEHADEEGVADLECDQSSVQVVPSPAPAVAVAVPVLMM